MNNCADHKKEVAGISDMTLLAVEIGDLHYETLAELLDKLSGKIFLDAAKDRANGRVRLADKLDIAATDLQFASTQIQSAWQISKPYMSAPPSSINEQEK